jgi:hypothetical protein
MASKHNRGREWRARVQQDFQMGRTEGKYRLTSMQVYQDDKLGKLLSRVERLEQGLRMVAAKGDDPTCDCGDCLCTRAVRKVALSYLKEDDDGE